MSYLLGQYVVQVTFTSIHPKKKKSYPLLYSCTLHVPLSLSILLINTAPDSSFLYRKSKFMGIDAIVFFFFSS